MHIRGVKKKEKKETSRRVTLRSPSINVKPTPYFSDSPVSLGSAGSPQGNPTTDAPSPINFPAPGESMADTSTLSPETNMPGSPGCQVRMSNEYLLGSPSPGPPRGGDSLHTGSSDGGGGRGSGQEGRDAGCSDRASPDSVFPDAGPMVSFRVADEQQQQHHQQSQQQHQQQQQRSPTPVPIKSSPYSPVQAVSSTPIAQETSSRSDSPDLKGDFSSVQTKEESDNSVFDGGGGGGGSGGSGGGRSETSNQPSHRNSPSSQFNISPGTVGSAGSHGSLQQQQQSPPAPPRSRAPSVPPHLLAAHHQFWSQSTSVQGFATQRLLNGVISSAVSYGGQNVTTVSTSSGGGTSSSSGINSSASITTGATTTATSCKYCDLRCIISYF